MMSLLPDSNSISSDSDEDFKYACSVPEARLFVENLWNRYREHADKDFAQKIPTRFHDHFWEMYLACLLADNGNNLLPKTKWKGPDIEIESAVFSRIWVEATTASPGSGKDRVPQPEFDSKMWSWFSVPEERIVLRYATAIDAKYQKYVQYTEENVVEKSDPYIIAVNGSKIPLSWDSDDDIPYIVQAVLPLGSPTIEISWDTPEEPTPGYAHRPEIVKVSGNSVPTNLFLDKKYEGISGVLSSRASIREFRGTMGMDFIFVHNPLALNKLPEGWLKIGREFRFRGDSFQWTRWSE